MVTVINDRGSNLGAVAGQAIGKGLSNLINDKINRLQQKTQQKERGDVYDKLGLPRTLSELPDDFQQLLLKEYDLAPAWEKEQFKNQINQIAQEEPEDDMEGVVTGPEGNQYTPIDVARQKEQQKSSLPGLNYSRS